MEKNALHRPESKETDKLLSEMRHLCTTLFEGNMQAFKVLFHRYNFILKNFLRKFKLN
jgi:hypothetical protein